MKRCGIYLITHTATGRQYVGQSTNSCTESTVYGGVTVKF